MHNTKFCKKTFVAVIVTAVAVVAAAALFGCGGGTTGEIKTPDAATPTVGAGLAPGRPSAQDERQVDGEVGTTVDPATVVKGTMTDPRDGKTYKTVTIGAQTWMAENLNYRDSSWDKNDVGEDVKVEVGDKGSWCYENSADNCAKYGRLYTWNAAKEACPIGWHLPSIAEWNELFDAVGGDEIAGTKLKSQNDWKSDDENDTQIGTDTYGFSALPGGYRRLVGYGAGYHGYWWLGLEDEEYAYALYMDYDARDVSTSNNFKNNGLSVRCVAGD